MSYGHDTFSVMDPEEGTQTEKEDPLLVRPIEAVALTFPLGTSNKTLQFPPEKETPFFKENLPRELRSLLFPGQLPLFCE